MQIYRDIFQAKPLQQQCHSAQMNITKESTTQHDLITKVPIGKSSTKKDTTSFSVKTNGRGT